MASGDILWVCEPLAGQAPDTNPAGLAWIAGASNHQIPVLTYDASTQEYMDFKCFMPAHYDGGGCTLTLVWSADQTATTDNVKWDAQFKRIQDDAESQDTAAYATEQTVTAVEPTATGEVAYDDITFTDGAQMDSTAAGEGFYLRISRDSADAADTLETNDVELHLAILKET